MQKNPYSILNFMSLWIPTTSNINNSPRDVLLHNQEAKESQCQLVTCLFSWTFFGVLQGRLIGMDFNVDPMETIQDTERKGLPLIHETPEGSFFDLGLV